MRSTREEVLLLVLLVLAVDAFFVAVYFLAGIARSSDIAKITFTAIWTVLTLAVVIRGLTRIRTARIKRSSPA